MPYAPPPSKPVEHVDTRPHVLPSWWGVAHMRRDGAIVMDSRVMMEDGTVNEGRNIFEKNDKYYNKVLQHLGGMKPGEEKIVPPWTSGGK